MAYPIIDIEGIGKTYTNKLKGAGISRTGHLLERAATPAGRKALAAATGIDEARILKWTNMADLMRVKGVGEEYSELLEAAGVDTVKELRTRNADNLWAAMKEANAKKKLVRQLPGAAAVARWVAHAKELKPVMTY